MFKFSRDFFILFIVVTVLPVLAMIFWNLYSTQKISALHIKSIIEIETYLSKVQLRSFQENKKKQLKGIFENVQEYSPDLNKYKKLFDAEKIFWIQKISTGKNERKLELIDNKGNIVNSYPINQDMLDKEASFFDTYYDAKKEKWQLVYIFVFKHKTAEHSGLYSINQVPLERILAHKPRIIMRVSTDNIESKHNIIYFSLDNKDLEEIKHMPKPPPPPKPRADVELTGKQYNIEGYDNKAVAMVEIGIPLRKKSFWILDHPMLRDVFRNIYLLGALIPALGLILTFLAGYYLKRTYLNPIEELSISSKEVTRGNYSCRVNTQTASLEIQDTLNNFNHMLQSIEEKEKLRENFISNLTHDLKTPLIAENRTLELLNELIQDKTDQKDLIVGLLKNNQHLLTMVDILLETYTFQDTFIKIHSTTVNIEELLSDCITQLINLAEEKNISIKNEIPQDLPSIEADINLLKRCFINILINAIENIPLHSEIRVQSQYQEDVLKVSIKDNGSGIPEEELDKIFEKYYSSKRTERKVGSGLGLYICKKIIEAHGGMITVSSQLNEYTEFIITLPVKRGEKQVGSNN
jgi:signal transduction histidine kinase